MKKYQFCAIAFAASALLISSCGDKKQDKASSEKSSTPTETTASNEKTEVALTAQEVEIPFNSTPVTGSLSEFISVVGNPTPSVKFVGTPDSEDFGVVKTTVTLNVQPNELFYQWAAKSPLRLVVKGDGDKNLGLSFTLSNEDKEKIETALKGKTAQKIEVNYEDRLYKEKYKSLFGEGKVAMLDNADGEMKVVEQPEISEDEDLFQQSEWVKMLDTENGEVIHYPYYIKKDNDGTYWRNFAQGGNTYFVKALHNYDTTYKGHDVSGYKYYAVMEKNPSKKRFYFNP